MVEIGDKVSSTPKLCRHRYKMHCKLCRHLKNVFRSDIKFDFLENPEFPARNPGVLENPEFSGNIPVFLKFLVGILDS